MSNSNEPFSDPQAVARYAEGPRRIVPGFHDLHRMTTLLLAERAPQSAHMLVLGAGGGLELKTFAETHPDWTFTGIDPSLEMLQLAEKTLVSYKNRIHLHHGYLAEAPQERYDGATCLLTLHFVPREERRQIAADLHHRLKPGAPLVVAHLSFPQDPDQKTLWYERYLAFSDTKDSELNRAAFESRLNILSPAEDESVLREAGFSDINLFYAGFAFRGWVAHA